MLNQWDERFSSNHYVYGKDPNVFLAEQLALLHPGSILLPCEGEGRNAVYAASKGWKTTAFDGSIQGKRKAEQLAQDTGFTIDYHIGNAETIEFPIASFDCIALIYAHFPIEIRPFIHGKMMSFLKPGGSLIIEAFNPLQIPLSSGGPKDPTMLYTTEMMSSDFYLLTPIINSEEETVLHEGPLHQGSAQVLRFVGIKQT